MLSKKSDYQPLQTRGKHLSDSRSVRTLKIFSMFLNAMSFLQNTSQTWIGLCSSHRYHFHSFHYKECKNWTEMHWVAQTSFSAPMKRLMLLNSVKKHFPMGHQQWQYTQMRRIHLLHVCLPKVHFFKQATAVVPFPETQPSCVCICATLFS